MTEATTNAAPPPTTDQEGYLAQFARARAAGHVPPAGFKIGATAKAMQEYLNVSGPLAGYMAGPLLGEGVELPIAGFFNPGVECEIAFRLGADLPPGTLSRQDAANSVAACFPAIEIVEQRYGDFRRLGAPVLIADQVFHRAAVIGTDAEFDLMHLDQVEGRMLRNGYELGRGLGSALLGYPLDALRWLAASGAAEAFGGLKAGQVVLCGSVTPAFWQQKPGDIRVDFGPLGSVGFRFT